MPSVRARDPLRKGGFVSDFPPDDVLVARGKYSTIASERRTLLKGLREDMEALAENARRVLRTEDLEFCLEQAESARARVARALERLEKLRSVAEQLDELKPLAWGQKEPE